MKICNKCNETKDVTSFYRKKCSKDGFQPHCKTCDNARNDLRRLTPEYKANRKIWETTNKDQIAQYKKEYCAKYFLEHREDYLRRNRQWRAKNHEKAKSDERNRFQKPSRKIKHKINQAFRRARKLSATIPGYEQQIAEIYQNCPVGYHVDHIVPLRGKEVCGLHVPWNLQYLPALENIRKGNR